MSKKWQKSIKIVIFEVQNGQKSSFLSVFDSFSYWLPTKNALFEKMQNVSQKWTKCHLIHCLTCNHTGTHVGRPISFMYRTAFLRSQVGP